VIGILGEHATESRNAGAEYVHGMRGGGQQLEGLLDGRGKTAQRAEMSLIGGELQGVGQLAVDEQVGHFFELAVGGEVGDVVAAVVEVVAVAAYGTEGGVASGDSGESYGFLWLEWGGSSFGGHVHPCEAGANVVVPSTAGSRRVRRLRSR